MSFSPEIFKKKLDALQETQDSIVSISQWVLFHHRHATHLCELWAQYALDSNLAATSKKKLSLLYLCNDVVQQARHKRKPEFSAGFAPLLPPVIHAIYGSVDSAIKPKIERLITVWSERNVFTKPQIDSMNRAVRSSKEGTPFTAETGVSEENANGYSNNGTTNSHISPELVNLNTLYTHMNKLTQTSSANLAQIGSQAKTYLPEDPSTSDNLPSPKVYVTKLNILEKLCHMTVSNLEDAKKTKVELLNALAQLTALVNDASPTEDAKIELLSQKLAQISSTRAELLEMIDEPESTPDSTVASEQTKETKEEEEEEDEEPSPVFESASDNNDDIVPTYEDSSDDSDEEPLVPPKRSQAESAITSEPKRRKLSGSSTTSAVSKKSVAFSEEIEVKEFERDDQSHYVDVMGDSAHDEEDDGYEPGADLHDFESHHKDAVELMHDHLQDGSESSTHNGSSQEGEHDKGGLLSLLSKLN